MVYSIFLICCIFYGIASFTSDIGNGNIRYEDGKFIHYEGKPSPEELILYRPIIFVDGIGMLMYDMLVLISIIAVIAIFVICLWKLEWYIPVIGLTALIPFGKFTGNILIKSIIGGIASPLSNLIVIALTTIFIIKVFA